MSRRRWDELDPELREDLQARTKRNRELARLLRELRREQRGPRGRPRRGRHRVELDRRGWVAYQRIAPLMLALDDLAGRPRQANYHKGRSLSRLLVQWVAHALLTLQEAGYPLAADDLELIERNPYGTDHTDRNPEQAGSAAPA